MDHEPGSTRCFSSHLKRRRFLRFEGRTRHPQAHETVHLETGIAEPRFEFEFDIARRPSLGSIESSGGEFQNRLVVQRQFMGGFRRVQCRRPDEDDGVLRNHLGNRSRLPDDTLFAIPCVFPGTGPVDAPPRCVVPLVTRAEGAGKAFDIERFGHYLPGSPENANRTQNDPSRSHLKPFCDCSEYMCTWTLSRRRADLAGRMSEGQARRALGPKGGRQGRRPLIVTAGCGVRSARETSRGP